MEKIFTSVEKDIILIGLDLYLESIEKDKNSTLQDEEKIKNLYYKILKL